MNKLLMTVSACLGVRLAFAYSGSLHLVVEDDLNRPVEDVGVVVAALNRTGFNAGKKPEDYDRYCGRTRADGVVDVDFDTVDGSFRWWIEAPGYYVPRLREEQLRVVRLEPSESAKEQVAEERLAIKNGTGGDWTKIFRLGEPFSVVGHAITNFVRISRRRHPRPLLCQYRGRKMLPRLSRKAMADGYVSNTVDRVGYDLEIQSPIPAGAKEIDGYVADFWITRSCSGTESNLAFNARIDFAPGCGAYKATKTSVEYGPFCYEADTNRIFSSCIEYSYKLVDGEISEVVPIATKDEYLVLRTRAVKDSQGRYSDWNYSLISGPIDGWREFSYDMLLFNPKSGDAGLEPEAW